MISVFNLNGGASIWWEYLKEIKRMKKRKLNLKQFVRYFCKDYLSGKYYDEEIKEFFVLKVGKLTLDMYEKRLWSC
jgi:hypothetical protein